METMEGLKEFIYVAENKGFSAAARVLKVSKSHVSKRINKLEQNLQILLFNRTTRSLTLTDSGRALYERSKHIFNELDDIYNEITQTQKEVTGSLKISVAGTFAEEQLSQIFSSFMSSNSKVKLELYFSERIVDLTAEGFDLAIRYGKLADSSLIAKKISSRREFICATPEYLSKYGKPKIPKDLLKLKCLLGNNEKWEFVKNKKREVVKVRGPWKSNNGRALTTAVKNGLGIARLPEEYVLEDIKSGILVSLLDDYTQIEQDIWLVYPERKHLPQKVRVLINYLSSSLNP